jgi:APA family basic amino acid/polyamine antiporter
MIGNILGAGIFQAPASIAEETGNPGVVLAFWVAGGLLSLFGALSVAELAAALPRSGGLYLYLHEGLGPRVAFVFGWAYLLLMKPFAGAALSIVFATYLNSLLGTHWPDPAVACGLVFSLTILNAVSVRGTAWTAIGLTALKILSLALIVGLGVVLMKGSAANFALTPSPKPLWMAAAPILYATLWTYDGWVDVASVAGEVENPDRNLPRILSLGMIAIIVLYLAVNIVYLSLAPLAELRGHDTVAPLILERLLGKAGSVVVTAIMVVSILGAANGAILAGARVTWAQARDGLLFRFLARVHPTFQTPDVSLWVQAVLTAGAVFYLRRFKDLSEGYGFLMGIFYAGAVAAVLILRRRRPDLPRPYKCWGYPVVPIVFIVVSLLMVGLYIAHDPKTTLPWVGVMLLGWPAHAIWTRVTRRDRMSAS